MTVHIECTHPQPRKQHADRRRGDRRFETDVFPECLTFVHRRTHQSDSGLVLMKDAPTEITWGKPICAAAVKRRDPLIGRRQRAHHAGSNQFFHCFATIFSGMKSQHFVTSGFHDGLSVLYALCGDVGHRHSDQGLIIRVLSKSLQDSLSVATFSVESSSKKCTGMAGGFAGERCWVIGGGPSGQRIKVPKTFT